jgi:hypothetical protein
LLIVHLSFYVQESQKVTAIFVYIRSDVGNTERDEGCKKYYPSVICALLIFIVFSDGG